MKQLDPKAVWLFFISFVLRWLITLVILGVYLSVFINNAAFWLLNSLWIIPVFLTLCFIWAKLSYHFYRYELTDAGFLKELGVIRKKYVTITYDRIQNVDIHRGIIARLLGLSDLQIQTAGSSAVVSRGFAFGMGSEGRLPGVSKEIAEQLRDELVQKARHYKTQGL